MKDERVQFLPRLAVCHARRSEAFRASGDDILAYLIKHLALDPGVLSPEDIRENRMSVREGFPRPVGLPTFRWHAHLDHHRSRSLIYLHLAPMRVPNYSSRNWIASLGLLIAEITFSATFAISLSPQKGSVIS